jgi:hypothetical protein
VDRETPQEKGEIVIYSDLDGSVKTEVRLHDDNLWLTQYQMAELFQTDRTSLVKHIRNIFETGELSESATCAEFAQVRQEGKRWLRKKKKR